MLKNFSVYLIGLIPLSLILGPFVSELLLFLVFIICSINLYNEKKFYIFDNKIFKYYLLFCVYISVVSLFSSEILVSTKSSFFYLRFGIYSICILYFLSEVKNSTKIIYNIYKYTILFLIIDSTVQIFFGTDIFGIKPENEDLMRISGPFGDKYILGSFLQKILPVYLYLIFKNSQTNNKINLLDNIILIFSLTLIYRSGDRSALALIFLFGLFFLIINRDLRIKFSLTILLFLMMAIFLTLQNPKIFERNFKDTIGQIKGKYYESFMKKDVSETNLNFMIFSFHHQSHFSTAFRMFLDKPLTGHGVKMFRYECDKFEFISPKNIEVFGEVKNYGCSTHPHNTYFQLLSETGIIGFLTVFGLFLFFSIKLISYFINNKKFYPESILALGIFVNLWPIIPTGNFFNNWLSMIYFIPISYYLYELNQKK